MLSPDWFASRCSADATAVQADKRLLQRVLEANRFSIRATTKEMVLERSEWGFRLQDIARPVTLFHGPS